MSNIKEFQRIDFYKWDYILNFLCNYCQSKYKQVDEDSLSKEILYSAELGIAIMEFPEQNTNETIEKTINRFKPFMNITRDHTKTLWKVTWFINLYVRTLVKDKKILVAEEHILAQKLVKAMVNHVYFKDIPACIFLKKNHFFEMTFEKINILKLFLDELSRFFEVGSSSPPPDWADELQIIFRNNFLGTINTTSFFAPQDIRGSNLFTNFTESEKELIALIVGISMSLGENVIELEYRAVSALLDQAGIPVRYTDKITKELENLGQLQIQ